MLSYNNFKKLDIVKKKELVGKNIVRRSLVRRFMKMYGLNNYALATLMNVSYNSGIVKKWVSGKNCMGITYMKMMNILSKGGIPFYDGRYKGNHVVIREDLMIIIMKRWEAMKGMVNKSGKKMFPNIGKHGL